MLDDKDSGNKKAGHTKGIILRQPGHHVLRDPLLSVPVLRQVWLYRGNISEQSV